MTYEHFKSAVLLQRTDSSYTFRITTKENDESTAKIYWRSTTEEEIAQIRHRVETYGGIADQLYPRTDLIKAKSKIDSIFLVQNDQKIEYIELSACCPIHTEPAIIFRICYFNEVVGLEPGFILDSFGDCVLSGNLVLSITKRTKIGRMSPFLTFGYGLFFPYKEEMVNFGCGIKCQFLKSLGIRLEYIVFTTWEAGYIGPSAGLSYFFKL